VTDARDPELPERLRRRLDAVFGEVLPEVTRDEAPEPDVRDPDAGAPAPPDPGAGDRPGRGPSAQDAWLRANRPPHHDRD
jgi:hypothetical protein